jgi:hypothetical protein
MAASHMEIKWVSSKRTMRLWSVEQLTCFTIYLKMGSCIPGEMEEELSPDLK